MNATVDKGFRLIVLWLGASMICQAFIGGFLQIIEVSMPRASLTLSLVCGAAIVLWLQRQKYET